MPHPPRIRWSMRAPALLAALAALALPAGATAHVVDGFDADKDLGSLYYNVQEVLGAGEYWNDGYTGKGVDVAVIDTGVAPVNGLRTAGKVVHGPDLSWESQLPDFRALDTFGHGTHMAGIIAGRDDAAPARIEKGNHDLFLGVAPDARIVNVKVADSLGATDVSQVIAAIDWVVQNRNRDGLKIRVLNLSYGTDGVQEAVADPLVHAVENAWRAGIVVVVSAGNGGFGTAQLNNPAYAPSVIAVGGSDPHGTYDKEDDTVEPWSSSGDASRPPDLVAPGRSIVSLRNEGSFADLEHPEGRVGTRWFRGSGTSQAAAFVSGAAALVISQRPAITPDELKALLVKTATTLENADKKAQGAGMIDLKAARGTKTPNVKTSKWRSEGSGSLELARGATHLVAQDGSELRGEQDIFGAPWNAVGWAAASLSGTSWAGGDWLGATWTGAGLTDTAWGASAWATAPWTRSSWRGDAWSANTWSANRWSKARWSGARWSASRWSSDSWAASRWSSAGWGQ